MSKLYPDESLRFHTGMDRHELEGWRDGIKILLEEQPNGVIVCHCPDLLVYLANAELEQIKFREEVLDVMKDFKS